MKLHCSPNSTSTWGSYFCSKELGRCAGMAAMWQPSPPHRRLVAARRLGRCAGLAAMLPPSPPHHRLFAARRLGRCAGRAAMLPQSPRRRPSSGPVSWSGGYVPAVSHRFCFLKNKPFSSSHADGQLVRFVLKEEEVHQSEVNGKLLVHGCPGRGRQRVLFRLYSPW